MIGKKISLVIPAYNEALILPDTLAQTLAFLSGSFDDYELVLSDDGSTDKTREIAENWPDAHLKCVSHFPNRGKGSAVRDGVLAAAGDIVVCTDADLAYGLNDIPAFVNLIENGADVAIGSRRLHPEGYAGYPPLRLLASRCFHFVTGKMAGFAYDTQCGLKAYSAEAAAAIFGSCETDGFAFDFEVLMLAEKQHFKIAEYPVKIINHRQSTVNVARDSVRMLKDVRRIRQSVNKRFR